MKLLFRSHEKMQVDSAIIYWFIISYTMDELRRNNLPNIIINQDKRERGFKE